MEGLSETNGLVKMECDGIAWNQLARIESSDDILKHSPKILNYINDLNFFLPGE
jgi:hypothetical protein